MNAHTLPKKKPSFHLFDNVKVFKDGWAFCYTCNCNHEAPTTCDLLFAGPSCKNLSGEFADRSAFTRCYETGEGSSGFTYVHGVLEAARATSPAVLYFENVLGVSKSSVVAGARVPAPIQAKDYI